MIPQQLLRNPQIAADWCDDNGLPIAAAWLRSEGILPPRSVITRGDGSGDGSGYGSGDGIGYGIGYGDGYGSGDGSGYGSGDGSGFQTLIPEANSMPAIGDYVIVRSRDSGCVCGEYRGHTGREVCLAIARQIWSWSGNRLALIDVSVVPGDTRLSAVSAGEIVLLEACAILPTTPEVEKYLRTAKAD